MGDGNKLNFEVVNCISELIFSKCFAILATTLQGLIERNKIIVALKQMTTILKKKEIDIINWSYAIYEGKKKIKLPKMIIRYNHTQRQLKPYPGQT